MYAKIIDNKLVYSSENMELVINDKLCVVSNPLEYDLIANGYKKIRIEQVEVKEKDFEEWECDIVVFEQLYSYKPTPFDLFDAEKAINRAMELLGARAYELGQFHFMISDSIRKKAFDVLKSNLGNLLLLNKITQSDYDFLKQALQEQNINLDNLPNNE